MNIHHLQYPAFSADFTIVPFSHALTGNKNRKTDGNHSANTDDQALFYFTKDHAPVRTLILLDKRMINHTR
jgi:hypothetical protein